MIITDRFVVLNNPKTGSSFVRAVLKELDGRQRRPWFDLRRGRRRFEELLLPNIRVNAERPRDQHGTYEQIPPAHRHKPVVSVVRNPYERLISDFTYRFWVEYPPLPAPLLAERFPRFPDISIDEFLEVRDLETSLSRAPDVKLLTELGYQTVLFIQMFFREPRRALARIDDSYLSADRFTEDLPEIHFLRTESLNEDLYRFLHGHGYGDEELDFILDHGRVNVTKPAKDAPVRTWTDGALRYVQEKERLLFRILESKGVVYGPPQQ